MKPKRRIPDRATGKLAPDTRPEWLGALCAGMLSALVVATPLIPTETVKLGGSALAIILLWLLLLLFWSLNAAMRGGLTLRAGPSLYCFLLFVAWHSLSAMVMSNEGHPRASVNMLWQWVGFLLVFFLARQLVHRQAEGRALVAVMLGLAVALSTLGYYQYFREFPQTRAHYLENRDKVLQAAGIHAPEGSPERAAFENRLLDSTEPFATFALANSLAGFLSPWLIAALGIAVTWHAPSGKRWRMAIVTGLTVLLIAGCLLLTKSRTAWLAVIGGIVLLAIYGRRTGWRPDWRIVGGAIVLSILLPILIFVIGGLDTLVLLEASKALLYRVQYWRGTAAMIADYPIFGCGPGNFQQYYTAYKLPEASETIAEPHNFLFEIWGTAGTPGILLLLGVFGCLAFQVWRVRSRSINAVASTAAEHERAADEPAGNVRPIYWGALAGALLAMGLCTTLEGYSLSPGLLLFGFPAAAAVLALWHPWVVGGRWSIAVPSIAIVVLLVNFLAAGGFSFAGVGTSLWILAALLLNHAGREGEGRGIERRSGLFASGIAAAALGAFLWTTYLPQLESGALIAEGDLQRVQGRPALALVSYRRAAEVDPYSPDGLERLAALANEAWLATQDTSYYDLFKRASTAFLERNRRSSVSYLQSGHWWLAGFRQFGSRKDLQEAIDRYEIAVKLYPNYNLGHAQLAWAYHLAGRDQDAAREAEEALRLDGLSPHREQKLSAQKVYDPSANHTEPSERVDEPTAEQRMLELRKLKGP